MSKRASPLETLGRASGLLCHVTSLPSPFQVGDVGQAARQFVDFLADAGQRVWQVLPLVPTEPGQGNSPYSSPSALAGNVLLVDPRDLVDLGLLAPGDIDPVSAPESQVDYPAAWRERWRILDLAWSRFQCLPPSHPLRERFAAFRQAEASWLVDHALFSALKAAFEGRPWMDWPEALARRRPEALAEARRSHGEAIERHAFHQFLFQEQYDRLRAHAREQGVRILGDLPIYVSQDSVDVWAHQHLFKLDASGRPKVVAGVPPDYFSRTGQLWGNPVYDWEACRAEGYAWWLARMERALALYDLVRIDHFRGFAAYWQVPAGHRTAIHGEWVQGPGAHFFEALLARFGRLPVVAEDLGTIDEPVRRLMAQFQLPGCRVLLFAFGDDMPDNPHKPANHVPNSVVYTGTHDNNTARGWYEEEADQAAKARLEAALGHPTDAAHVAWDLVQLALSSVSNLAILPVQDLLGLPSSARMNRPSVAEGNWRFRLLPGQLGEDLAARLRQATEASGRSPAG